MSSVEVPWQPQRLKNILDSDQRMSDKHYDAKDLTIALPESKGLDILTGRIFSETPGHDADAKAKIDLVLPPWHGPGRDSNFSVQTPGKSELSELVVWSSPVATATVSRPTSLNRGDSGKWDGPDDEIRMCTVSSEVTVLPPLSRQSSRAQEYATSPQGASDSSVARGAQVPSYCGFSNVLETRGGLVFSRGESYDVGPPSTAGPVLGSLPTACLSASGPTSISGQSDQPQVDTAPGQYSSGRLLEGAPQVLSLEELLNRNPTMFPASGLRVEEQVVHSHNGFEQHNVFPGGSPTLQPMPLLVPYSSQAQATVTPQGLQASHLSRGEEQYAAVAQVIQQMGSGAMMTGPSGIDIYQLQDSHTLSGNTLQSPGANWMVGGPQGVVPLTDMSPHPIDQSWQMSQVDQLQSTMMQQTLSDTLAPPYPHSLSQINPSGVPVEGPMQVSPLSPQITLQDLVDQGVRLVDVSDLNLMYSSQVYPTAFTGGGQASQQAAHPYLSLTAPIQLVQPMPSDVSAAQFGHIPLVGAHGQPLTFASATGLYGPVASAPLGRPFLRRDMGREPTRGGDALAMKDTRKSTPSSSSKGTGPGAKSGDKGKKRPDWRRVFVGNIGWWVDEVQLKEYFQQYGSIIDIQVMWNTKLLAKGKRVNREFAFISFSTQEEAANAIRWMHGCYIEGLTKDRDGLTVQYEAQGTSTNKQGHVKDTAEASRS